MADETSELERRLARLEAVVAALLMFETFAESPEEVAKLFSRLRGKSEKEDWIFWEEILFRLQRYDYPFNYRELRRRVQGLESSLEKTAPLADELRAELSLTKERVDSVFNFNSALQERVEGLSSELRADIKKLHTQKHDLYSRINEESQERENLQREFHSYLALLTLGLSLD